MPNTDRQPFSQNITGTIYLITNITNGMVYVGQTTRLFKKRMYEHRNNYVTSKKSNNLYKAIQEFGVNNFNFSIIQDNIKNITLLNELEKHYIQLYNSLNTNVGYNMVKGGYNTIKTPTVYSTSTELVIYQSKGVKSREVKNLKKQWGLYPKDSKVYKQPLKKYTYYIKKVDSNSAHRSKSIICLTTGETFKSVTEAASYFNIQRTSISHILSGEVKKTKNNLMFKYIN